MPQLLCANLSLHSMRNPQREAERIAQALFDPLSHECRQGVWLLCGVGWGYLIEPLLQLRCLEGQGNESKEIALFEPLDGVCQLLEREGRKEELNRQIRSYGYEPIWVENDTTLDNLLRTTTTPISLLIHPTWRRIASGAIVQLEARVTSQSRAGLVDRATSERFLRQWLRISLIRIEERQRLDFVDSQRTPAATATPVAAGVLHFGAAPELNDEVADLPAELKEPDSTLRRSIFITAVDTALAPLLAAGITPDLAISIDSGSATAWHLEAAAALHAPPLPFAVLTTLAGSPLLEHYFKELLLYRSTLPLDQLLGYGPLSTINEWANPSRNTIGLALRLADTLSIRHVALSGCSLSSRHNQSHARGSGYSRYARYNESRLSRSEGYLPRGYSRESENQSERANKKESARVKLTRDGVTTLAATLALELTDPLTLCRIAATTYSRELSRASPTSGLSVQSVDQGQLRRFLLQSAERLEREASSRNEFNQIEGELLRALDLYKAICGKKNVCS